MFALTAAPQVGAGTGLDRFAEWLQRSVGRTAARGPLRGVTSALSGERWFGHPLHPALAVRAYLGGHLVYRLGVGRMAGGAR